MLKLSNIQHINMYLQWILGQVIWIRKILYWKKVSLKKSRKLENEKNDKISQECALTVGRLECAGNSGHVVMVPYLAHILILSCLWSYLEKQQ